jgi:hypothetical protein
MDADVRIQSRPAVFAHPHAEFRISSGWRDEMKDLIGEVVMEHGVSDDG